MKPTEQYKLTGKWSIRRKYSGYPMATGMGDIIVNRTFNQSVIYVEDIKHPHFVSYIESTEIDLMLSERQYAIIESKLKESRHKEKSRTYLDIHVSEEINLRYTINEISVKETRIRGILCMYIKKPIMNKKEIESREIVDLMFKEHEEKISEGFKELIKHIDFCIDKINTKNEKL